MDVVAAARTDVGRVRQLNEDSIVCEAPLFAVADGMGGHAAGEVASGLVAEVLIALALHGQHTADGVREALALANARIREEAASRGASGGMGTTVVGVMLSGDAPLAFNIGDSRLYRFRDGRLEQLSTDHSMVQELVDAGTITAEEARAHPDRNVVTRAVGVDAEIDADVWELDLRAGDRVVVCSDGLVGEVTDEGIAAILADQSGSSGAAEELVMAALAAGGRDNVSVVVIDVIQTTAARGYPAVAESPARSGDTTEPRLRRTEEPATASEDVPASGVIAAVPGDSTPPVNDATVLVPEQLIDTVPSSAEPLAEPPSGGQESESATTAERRSDEGEVRAGDGVVRAR